MLANSYAAAYFLVYSVPFIEIIYLATVSKETPTVINFAFHVLYPLGGILNLFIYSRPKVVYFRHTHPGCSWFRAFWWVVGGGGEIPPDRETEVSSF